tara:strand:+ start:216 stop:890 length:675 start_codon:yes stop_codon:yes gene_type:complete
MGQIFSSTDDGFSLKTSSLSWAAARDATSGAFSSSAGHFNSYAVRASISSSGGRGGLTNTFFVSRAFFKFDTSGIHNIPVDAQIFIYGRTFTNADVILVKSNQQASGLSFGNADFDAIDGWVAGANNNGNVRKYSGIETSWTTSYNQMDLTGEALSDIVAYDSFKCCLIDYANDLRNNTPTAPSMTNNFSGVWFADEELTSKDPYLQYSEPAEPTQSLMLGTNF